MDWQVSQGCLLITMLQQGATSATLVMFVCKAWVAWHTHDDDSFNRITSGQTAPDESANLVAAAAAARHQGKMMIMMMMILTLHRKWAQQAPQGINCAHERHRNTVVTKL
jgi:hypothetical protein